MPQQLTVDLAENSYQISLDTGIIPSVGTNLFDMGFPRKVAIVTNAVVDDFYGDSLRSGLQAEGMDVTTIRIPEGEDHKNLHTVESIAEQLVDAGFDRSCGLLALGGGIVGDITGFVAATFLRGIPFVQIPTTLLSQVDSSVGGKTGVNLQSGKNLVGAFYQPRHVFIDVETLASLPEREFCSGMAEVIKHAIIADADYAEWLLSHRDDILARDADALVEMVAVSCRIKSEVVGVDERESSLRAVLNYGHTFGHAVETLTSYSYLHGEAVAIGMLVAAEVSRVKGLCSQDDVDTVRRLLEAFGLPTEIPKSSRAEYLSQMMRDKKVRNGKLRMVLNRGIGACVIEEVEDIEHFLADVFDDEFQPIRESVVPAPVAPAPVSAGTGQGTTSLGRIAEYVSRLEKNQGDAVFVDLANIYLKIDMIDDALLVARKGSLANPGLAAGQLILGRIYEKMHQESDAIDAFRRAVEAGSDDTRALKKVISAMLKGGEKSRVRPFVERLVSVAPGDDKAQQLLRSLPVTTVPQQNVISPAGAPKTGKKATINTATIAEIYLKQGLYQEALNVYSGILEELPDNPEALQKVAEIRRILAGEEAQTPEMTSTEKEDEVSAAPLVEPVVEQSTDSLSEEAGASCGDLKGTLEGWLDAIQLRRAHVS